MQALFTSKFTWFSIGIVSALLAMLSCASHQDVIQKEEKKISLSEIKQSGVSWGSRYFFDEPRFKDDKIKEQFDKALTQKLNTYGIKLDENTNHPLIISYTILLEEAASASEIKNELKKEPELQEQKDKASYAEHGKVTISIRDAKTYKPVWRNTAEGLAIFKMESELRQQRINELINEAFSTFPLN